MQNTLLEELKEKFESLNEVKNLALGNAVDKQKLLTFLLQDSKFNKEFQSRFSTQVSNTLIFDTQSFLTFLDSTLLHKSFTSFSSRIGLSDKNKNFLQKSENVVLNFPFKDCVLKGAQSKDNNKSNEVFFNEILAHDEIDVLFAPKALYHFELINTHNKFNIKEILNNKTMPNLLVKGNNLLALHSLKDKFAGKVKLIYIDPPYNTGNDSFNYNDKFNHSTWLTFMKNRLEIAKEFLRDDGVIFIQCDDNEQAYLKVLCDEIFGRENFVRQIIWRIGWVSGFKTTNEIVRNHDTILVYAKNSSNLKLQKIYIKRENFQNRFNDESKKEILKDLQNFGLDKNTAKDFFEKINTIGLPEKYPLETT